MSRATTERLLALAAVLALAAGGVAAAAPFGPAGLLEDAGLYMLGAAAAVLLVVLVFHDPAWALSLGVAATIFSGNWARVDSPMPFDRVLIGVGLVSLLVRARDVNGVLGRRPGPIHWLLLAASVYAVGSALFVGTLSDSDARFALLDSYGFVPFVLFAVAPVAFATERQRLILLGVLTGTGAYLAYISIMGRIGSDGLVWPGYVVDPAIGFHADRARGPFIEAGANGLALFECGAAAVLLATRLVDNRLRVLCGAVALACAFSIELTLTRSVWVASALGLALAVVAAPQTRRYVVPAAAAALILVFGALTVVPGLREDVRDRQNDSRPVWDRRNSNDAAVRMIADRPLFGFGWDEFRANNRDYQWLNDNNPMTRSDLDSHNVFLSNAVELGLIGAFLWALALVCAVGGAIVTRGPPELFGWRIALVAIAGQWFVVANFVPLGYAFPNALLWLWAGVVWGRPIRESRREPRPAEEPPVGDPHLGRLPYPASVSSA